MTNTILSEPTITDWIQAFGVLLGAIGLGINFVYQKKATAETIKATKAQLAMAERDFERYLLEVTPQLTFKTENLGTEHVFISIRVSDKPVLDFLIFNKSEDLIGLYGNHTPVTIPSNSNIAIGYQVKHPIDIFDEYGYDYNLEITYKDILGNVYRQKLTASSTSQTVNYSHPEKTLNDKLKPI